MLIKVNESLANFTKYIYVVRTDLFDEECTHTHLHTQNDNVTRGWMKIPMSWR